MFLIQPEQLPALPDNNEHSFLEKVISIHFQMFNHVIEHDPLPAECTDLICHLRMSEMDMQVEECWVVMKQCLHLGARESVSLFNRLE